MAACCCRLVGRGQGSSSCPRGFSTTTLFYAIVVFFSFVQLSHQQKDPLNDFCRRFGHQSAIVDRKLYLDGGLVDWNPISQNAANYSNTNLLYNDLDKVSSFGEPQLYANFSKNSSIPSLVGGVLWADDVNKRLFLFGGEYYQSPPAIYKLFSFDALYKQWDSFGTPSTPVDSVAWGAGVGISERGEGYYYGGWISNTTTPGYTGGATATSNLVKYDMDTNLWTKSTGPDTTQRAEGVMVYLPASDRGLLIYFGGVTQPYNNATITGSPMDSIFIFDIASGKWYTQSATGDVPEMRRRFCAGATWAQDQSSYNIYLYGGAGMPPNTTGFDDVYILSLPSFIWIKWYPTSPGVGSPHNSLTCNVIDGAQMLIIGGTFPLSDACDAPDVWGTHSLDLGKQNPDKAMWYGYRTNITTYVVPDEIVSKIGGNSLGGATVTAPAYWLNRDLPVYFTRTASNPVRTATRAVTTATSTNSTSSPTSSPSSSPGLTTGAIVGIAVGGAAFLILLTLGCCCFYRRRRKVTAVELPQPPYVHPPAGQYQQQYYPPPPPRELAADPSELSSHSHIHSPAQTPVYEMEPKYDTTASQALRNDSFHSVQPLQMQDHVHNGDINSQGIYPVWPPHPPSPAPQSPYQNQQLRSNTHSPVPSHSPRPSLASSHPSHYRSTGRDPYPPYPSPGQSPQASTISPARSQPPDTSSMDTRTTHGYGTERGYTWQ